MKNTLDMGNRKPKGTPLILRKIFLEELLAAKEFMFHPMG